MNFCAIIFITCLISVIQANVLENVEVYFNVTTEDNLAMKWTVSKLSKEKFALSGFVDFKEDIDTDDAEGWLDVYYSLTGSSYLSLTPFHFQPDTLTNLINSMYKEKIMETSSKCCENALVFEDTFEPPLKKRRIVCRKCLLKINDIPRHMRKGFYKKEYVVEGEIGFTFGLILKYKK